MSLQCMLSADVGTRDQSNTYSTLHIRTTSTVEEVSGVGIECKVITTHDDKSALWGASGTPAVRCGADAITSHTKHDLREQARVCDL